MWDVLCVLPAALHKCHLCLKAHAVLGVRGNSLRFGLHTHGGGVWYRVCEARALDFSTPGPLWRQW